MQEEREGAYLANIMCERRAKSEKIPLPPNYWNTPEWRVLFKRQVIAANSLLKIYPFEVVKSTIANKKVAWVWSLSSPALHQILLEEMAKFERQIKKDIQIQEKLDKREDTTKIEQAPVIFETPKKSLRNRLD